MRTSFLLIILIFCFTTNVHSKEESRVSEISNELNFSNPKVSNSDILFSQFGGSATVITEYDIKKSGASDVQELLRKVPGLSIKQSGGRGGVVSIFSRGSESDHNLVIIDGMPIYQKTHMFGFLSSTQAEAVKDVQVFKGGYPAKFGGRTSG